MIGFPDPQLPAAQAFAGTTLARWLPAGHVHAALALAAQAHAGRTALTFLASGEADAPQRRYSYGDYLDGVTRTANLLRALGVQRGDVVGYLLPALAQTHFVLWGAETAGIAFPINPLLQAEDIAALARAAGVKVLVALGRRRAPTSGTRPARCRHWPRASPRWSSWAGRHWTPPKPPKPMQQPWWTLTPRLRAAPRS